MVAVFMPLQSYINGAELNGAELNGAEPEKLSVRYACMYADALQSMPGVHIPHYATLP